MRLDLELAGGLVSFHLSTNRVAAYPYLEEVGSLHIAAVAGDPSGSGKGEAPSLDVVLRNDNGKVAAMLGNPLRARGTQYDRNGRQVFAGIVSAARYGRTIALTLEA